MKIGKYKYIIAIIITWSKNKFLPRAKYIQTKDKYNSYNIGYCNEIGEYTYRWYPVIRKIKV